MTKTKINSDQFAKRLGAYSHGYTVEIGDTKLIFTTGQIALDNDGNVLYPDDPAKQTEYVFEALQTILQESGASLNDVVKTTIFLTDMNDFPKISPIRNTYFKNSEPVSTLVEVSKLVKPGCRVEIEVIAVKKL
ncbi:MAG: RidA family protein [Patescibacteria group bacterium]